jgi:hypothetical protein
MIRIAAIVLPYGGPAMVQTIASHVCCVARPAAGSHLQRLHGPFLDAQRTEIHAGIELKVLAQFVREAGAEGDDVAARVLRVEAEPVRCLRLPGAVRSGLNSTTFPRRLP